MSNLLSSDLGAYCFKVILLSYVAKTVTPLGLTGWKQIIITSMAGLKWYFFHVYKMKPHSTSFSPSNKIMISPQTRYFFTASSAGFRFRIQSPPSNFSTGTTERLHWGHALNGPVHSSQTRAQSAQWTQTLKQLLCCGDKKHGKFKRHPDHWEGNTFATFDPSKVTRVSQARGERWFILVRQFSHLHCGNRSGRRCCAFHQSTAARLTKRTLHGWENKCFLALLIRCLCLLCVRLLFLSNGWREKCVQNFYYRVWLIK